MTSALSAQHSTVLFNASKADFNKLIGMVLLV
jgi:hypothetical protein